MKKTKPLCLIVDDDPDTYWALQHVLWQHDLPSHHAPNAEIALQRIGQRHYAVVLLDAKLPDMDGLDLVRRMRTLDPELQLILISGYFYQDDLAVREAQASGLIQGFIPKPYVHEDLMRAVKRTLGECAHSARCGTGAME